MATAPTRSRAAVATRPRQALTADDAPARVLRQFRQVFNAVKTHFQQVEKRSGIGGAQLWALSLIRDRPDLGVNALAQAMDIHQTTASNLVRALVEAGLVVAQKSGSDRRVVQLRALPAATRVLQRAPSPFAGVLPDALQRLDPHTLLRLEADLEALLQQLQPDTRAAGIPLAQM